MSFRARPYSNGNFRVTIEGDPDAVAAGFQEIIMPEFKLGVFDYRNGNEKRNSPRKINADHEVSNVILKRGLIGEGTLYKWVETVRDGKQEKSLKNVIVELLDESREDIAVAWELINARPVRYTLSDLKSQSDGIVMEIIELAFEDLDVRFE